MSRSLGYFVRLNPAGRDQVRVIQELRRLRVPFTVIGGVAMAVYRDGRQTKDVDLIVQPPAGVSLRQLAEHLASVVPHAKAKRSSHEPGKDYFRVMIPRKGKRPLPVADVAPPELYPQYAEAHRAPHTVLIQDFEGYGRVPVAGRGEMLALKTKAALSPNRRDVHAGDDLADARWLVSKASPSEISRARSLVGDVLGGAALIDRLLREREAARRRRPNWRPRFQGAQGVPHVPPPLGTRCPTCGRVVRLVRGGRFRAHDFMYRRCVGSGALVAS